MNLTDRVSFGRQESLRTLRRSPQPQPPSAPVSRRCTERWPRPRHGLSSWTSTTGSWTSGVGSSTTPCTACRTKTTCGRCPNGGRSTPTGRRRSRRAGRTKGPQGGRPPGGRRCTREEVQVVSPRRTERRQGTEAAGALTLRASPHVERRPYSLASLGRKGPCSGRRRRRRDPIVRLNTVLPPPRDVRQVIARPGPLGTCLVLYRSGPRDAPGHKAFPRDPRVGGRSVAVSVLAFTDRKRYKTAVTLAVLPTPYRGLSKGFLRSPGRGYSHSPHRPGQVTPVSTQF